MPPLAGSAICRQAWTSLEERRREVERLLRDAPDASAVAKARRMFVRLLPSGALGGGGRIEDATADFKTNAPNLWGEHLLKNRLAPTPYCITVMSVAAEDPPGVFSSSFANLALVCGAGNRPGQVVSRLGGHQRGWMGAASYPISPSPNKLQGRRRQEIDLDRWLEAGKLRFAWVIGTTWTGAMAGSSQLAKRMRELTVGKGIDVERADRGHAIEGLKARIDAGGMVMVHQDIYSSSPRYAYRGRAPRGRDMWELGASARSGRGR